MEDHPCGLPIWLQRAYSIRRRSS